MFSLKKLPDAEFALMKIIWSYPPPLSTNDIISRLEGTNSWKPQTVLTLLMRLKEKGFLSSERRGKERIYYPIVTEDEYLRFETSSFMNKFYKNSLTSLVSTLFQNENITEQDLNELSDFLKENGGEGDGTKD